LFTQVDKTMELLLSKYLKAAISYEGIQRVESYPIPESALREAVLTAIVHRDCAVAAPIQIRVHEDRLRIRIRVTPDGVKYHLDRLRKAGRIRHVGPTKKGRWEVLEDDEGDLRPPLDD
jgi:predicted HTH transcriptional regulator